MRVALLHPTYWPEVRRGSERLVHDVAAGLSQRGAEVTVLTTGPSRATVGREDGFTVVRARRAPARVAGRRHYADHLGVVPAQLYGLLRRRFDVAHAFYPVDAWAAVRARRLGGPPVVFSIHGILTREWLVRRRYRLPMALAAAREAAACTVLSEAAAGPCRRYLLREPEVLPGGVACDVFAVDRSREAAPTLVCAADLSDPRKRGRLLLDAFARLRRARPDARLVLAGPQGPVERGSLQIGVEEAVPGTTATLARTYASAWASVLPAVDEAFGLVILESLAAGTPVVAARSGAAPGLVSEERVGRLFEPDDPADLARAMDESLGLAADRSTVQACRERARAYDWSMVLPRYEALHRRVVGW